MKVIRGCILTFLLLTVAVAQDKADLSMIHRIKAEAFQNSKIMEHVFFLTDVHGPRLTNSPGYRSSGEWSVKRLAEYGLVNARLEKWGPFGRGWSHSRFSAHMLEPQYSTLIGFPLAWSPGTEGPVTAEVVHAVMRTEEDLNRHKGKLQGKIVMIDPPRSLEMVTAAPGRRLSETELQALWMAPDPSPRRPMAGPPMLGPMPPTPSPAPQMQDFRKLTARRNQFLKDEGVVAVLTTGYRGDGGTVFATSGGSRDAKEPTPPPMAAIAGEHYNRIVRLLENKVPVRVELDIRAAFHDETLDSFNVIAEIPGHSKKDEVVILGAHLDSWHAATGATDNASGCAVVIEAVRILQALEVKMDRTVRVALWGGEEQGLLGSRAYVRDTFADPDTMQLKPAHAQVAAYYNYDNGGGKIRGIYLQNNDMLRETFEAWMAPFKDLGASTVTIRNTSGTDHLAFDAVGLPGFQFIQDPLEYSTRTHHSNMDVYDRIQPGDLMQSAVIMASFAYHTATRRDLLPRKPLPKPRVRPQEKKAASPAS